MKDCQVGFADRRRIADFGRQRDRLDAEQPKRPPADLNAAFEDRRHRPAGTAQIDKELLREGRAVAPDQHRGSRAAESGGGAVVAGCGPAGSAPARRSTARSRKSARSATSPAASDAGANGSSRTARYPDGAAHAISPALRLTWRSSVAASRALWVTIRKPQPVRDDQVAGQRQNLVRGRLVEIAGRFVGEQQAAASPPSARPIATRCCWPPDNCSGIAAQAGRPVRAAPPVRPARRRRAGRQCGTGRRGYPRTFRLGIRLNC